MAGGALEVRTRSGFSSARTNRMSADAPDLALIQTVAEPTINVS
jgi:hypothetical protein